MLILMEEIISIYQKIISSLNISEISVIIFTSLDADSVCTYKIISKLLQSQSICFKGYPVSCYSEFNNKIQQSKVFKQVKLFFFINCGGIIDLTQKWFIDSAEVFLLDTNKPIHHKNIESEKIRVIDEGKGDFKHFPTSEDFQKLDQLEQYDIDQQDEDEENDQEEESQIGGERSPKRKNTVGLAKKIRKHKTLLENKIDNYYSKQYFSIPSSHLAYRLIRDLNKQTNDFLWYAIVGLTSMYLEQRLNKEVLDVLTIIYREDMTKLNPQTDRRQKGSIGSKMDFQFTLMRHWSLYDSIINSSYMLIKLRLWEDQGKRKLNELLTTIGISLNEAKQLYKYMTRQAKQKLKNNLFIHAQKFSILDVAYHSFFRQIEHDSKLMASSYAYSIINTLERSQKFKVNLNTLNDHRVSNFWEAHHLLDGTQSQIISQIDQYKANAVIMCTEACHMVERDHIIKGTTFYFSNMRNDTAERKIFQHPYTLIRLAHLLMGIQQQRKKARKQKPYIASLQDVQNNRCVVVGVMGQQKNSFGPKFLQVSTSLNMKVQHDSFLANIMNVEKDNLLQFIKQLRKYSA